MVQPAESRQGLNLASTRTADFCRPICWRVLREPKMRPVLGPAHSQHNPEQFVYGSQSTARSLHVQCQQLPTESHVFEDEVRPAMQRLWLVGTIEEGAHRECK